jgi:hypothetical protein
MSTLPALPQDPVPTRRVNIYVTRDVAFNLDNIHRLIQLFTELNPRKVGAALEITQGARRLSAQASAIARPSKKKS